MDGIPQAISLKEKIDLVKKQPCFFKLSANEIEELASLFLEKKFRANATIVTEGDPVDEVFLIVEGSANVELVRLHEGVTQKQSLAVLKAGDAIGLNETGFYSLSGKRTATVVAGTDLIVLGLSVAKFHGFALAYPHVNEVMRSSANTLTL